MRIIIVYLGDLLHCPPAMSLGRILNDLNYEVKYLTYVDQSMEFEQYFKTLKNVKFISIGESNTKGNVIKKVSRLFSIKKNTWNRINEEYTEESLIWVVSNGTLKYLGKKLLSKNYVLHLLELTEELYYIESKHLLPLSRDYAKKANLVIECEYNRAHITKAWWDLCVLPGVLQNKPYNCNNIMRNSSITSSVAIQSVISQLKGRKIILYQGNISKERPLDIYIEAVSQLGDEYAFVAMVNGENPYGGNSDNFYYIPFVKPPLHLEITSHASIGILSYTPVKNSYSILNTLYCAPNKIWEYSMFGIPMISNDLPALNTHFNNYHDGLCLEKISVETVKEALVTIFDNYDYYSKNSKRFFDEYDIKRETELLVERAMNNRKDF